MSVYELGRSGSDGGLTFVQCAPPSVVRQSSTGDTPADRRSMEGSTHDQPVDAVTILVG